MLCFPFLKRTPVVLLLVVSIAVVGLVGCGGGGGGASSANSSGSIGPATDGIPNYNPPSRWIELIAQAGLQSYADLGSQVDVARKVILVSPPTLSETFNAFTWINEGEIWINSPMFERYPDVVDQGEIFLHELIHLSSGETSHEGPWWSDLTLYRAYWASHTPS